MSWKCRYITAHHLPIFNDFSVILLFQVHTEKQRHDINRTGPLVTDTIQEVSQTVNHLPSQLLNINLHIVNFVGAVKECKDRD